MQPYLKVLWHRSLTLCDEYGIIYEAIDILPNNECHRTRTFPKTRLHKVKGIKQAVYRADIDKISGWRIHIQYIDGQIHLKDIIEGKKHDNTLEVIKSKKSRYE